MDNWTILLACKWPTSLWSLWSVWNAIFFYIKIGGLSLIHFFEDVSTACRFKVKVNCARSTQCSKRGKHSPIFWGFGCTLAAKILQGLQSILPHCCILATLGHSQWRDQDLSSSTKANLIVLWLLYKSVDVILATGSLLDRQLMISRCHSCLRRPVSPTLEEGRKTLRWRNYQVGLVYVAQSLQTGSIRIPYWSEVLYDAVFSVFSDPKLAWDFL